MVKIKQQMPLAPKPPCEKDCPDRSSVCAVNCERWSAYVKARGEYYAEKLKISKSNARTAARNKHVENIPGQKKKYPGRL